MMDQRMHACMATKVVRLNVIPQMDNTPLRAKPTSTVIFIPSASNSSFTGTPILLMFAVICIWSRSQRAVCCCYEY